MVLFQLKYKCKILFLTKPFCISTYFLVTQLNIMGKTHVNCNL